MSHKDNFILDLKKSLLPVSEIRNIKIEGLRAAAVLIPLVWEDDQWNLLFIHRANIGEFHRGEVAFPGGGEEPEDKDLIATALRETKEELGIFPNDVEILGFLHSVSTISRYYVTPIVGLVKWPQDLNIEVNEVMHAFMIPISWLKDPENWSNIEIDVPDRGKINTVMYKDYGNEHLWGLTAKITLDLLQRCQ